MSDCSHDCSSCSKDCAERKDFREKQNELSNIKKVIAIAFLGYIFEVKY